MKSSYVLALAGTLALAGCTTTLERNDLNRITPAQYKKARAVQTYLTTTTNEVARVPLKVLSPDHLSFYIDFPRATYTFHSIPAGTNAQEHAYWNEHIDTTAPLINQSIPPLERIAQTFPQGGQVSRLTFADEHAVIGARSGLRAIEFYHTGTNDALAIQVQRTTGIKQGKDTEQYDFTISTDAKNTRIRSNDKNYLAALNIAEATGIGMAILPLQGGIFGAGTAFQEGMFYWNTRHPNVHHTKVNTITDMGPRGHTRRMSEVAHTLGANIIYQHKTDQGTILVYCTDTTRPRAGFNVEEKLPANTFTAHAERQARSHCAGFFWRAAQAGTGAGILRAVPFEKKILQTLPTPSAPGVSGGSVGGVGGR